MRAPSRSHTGWLTRPGIVVLAVLLFAMAIQTEAQQAAKTPRIGVLFLTSPSSVAGAAGLEALRASLRDLGYVDLARAFATTPGLRPHAIIFGPDPLFFEYRNQVLDFARSARLPAMYPFRDFVDAGGLMSYSVNSQDVVRRTARLVDRILKGAKPVDLPVEEPTMYELVINLNTAKALGLVIPPSLRLRADHVVE